MKKQFCERFYFYEPLSLEERITAYIKGNNVSVVCMASFGDSVYVVFECNQMNLKRELSEGCKNCQHNTVCSEIENLKCRNEFIWYQAESGCPHFQTDIETEAIKEFAEKVKQGLPSWLHPYIDTVQKEMVGEKNETYL